MAPDIAVSQQPNTPSLSPNVLVADLGYKPTQTNIMVSTSESKIPSRERVEPGSVDIPLATFPSSATSTPADPSKIVDELVSTFNQALSKKDYSSVASLFLENGYWRDHLAVSWDLHTLKSPEKIEKFLKQGCRLTKITVDSSSTIRAPQVGSIDGLGNVMGIIFFLTFETDIGAGRGIARLAETSSGWKFYTLFTSLEELQGHEEPVNQRRTKGAAHGGDPNRKNWLEHRTSATSFEDRDPAVLIVGKLSHL